MLDALGLLLAFDAPREARDVEGHRMYGHIPAQPLDKLQPPLLLRLRLGAVGSVHEFGDSHDRQADLGFPWLACTCSRICRTLWPLRSAVMMTLESRIIPTRAGSTLCGF
jgi:hypothetical protein